jgi:8-oxo-dGTP diphosphatase
MRKTKLFVGAVVRRGDEVLLVRQSPGHSLAGQWTIPWGRVEAGESPMAAAVREVREEGGVEAAVEGLLGVQELPPPQAGGVALVYLCKHVSGEASPDAETDAACYYRAAAFAALVEPKEPWSDWLVQRIFAGRFTLACSDAKNPLGAQGSFL